MIVGDVVLNTCAGESNPHRYGMVIGFSSIKTNRFHRSPTVKVMHSDGETSEYYKRDNFLKVVGRIPFLKQIDALVQQNSGSMESCQQHITKAKSARSQICPKCHGDGGPPGNECPYCNGSGEKKK